MDLMEAHPTYLTLPYLSFHHNTCLVILNHILSSLLFSYLLSFFLSLLSSPGGKCFHEIMKTHLVKEFSCIPTSYSLHPVIPCCLALLALRPRATRTVALIPAEIL